MSKHNQIEDQLAKLEFKCKSNDLNYAWNNSWFRRIMTAVLTYLVVLLFFVVGQLPRPLINALIPTVGFILSTLTIGYFKKIWIKYIYFEQQDIKKNNH